MVKDSAAHCNVVFFALLAVASGDSGFTWGNPKEPKTSKRGRKPH
jgi:hypothetical protein